jgi:hypothetical protein
MGAQVNIKETIMDQKEAEKFLEMEVKYWRGGNKNT